MSNSLTTNKYFVVTLVLSIILGGMTFGNLPGVAPAAPVLVVGGETFNFGDYGTVTHEQVAIFNYLTTLFDQSTGSWDGWYIEPQYYGLFHYVLAFMAYSLAMYYETTPGYRTDYYSDVSSGLIEKFNTSYADYGEDSLNIWSGSILPSGGTGLIITILMRSILMETTFTPVDSKVLPILCGLHITR